MKVFQVKVLIKNLRNDLKRHKEESIYPSKSEQIQYENLFNLVRKFLPEHSEFIYQSERTINRIADMLSSLDYLEIIFDMKIKELESEHKDNRKFLDSAQDKLKQAGIAFDNKDYSGVSNKLNTAIELALKDILDIPSTIKGVPTSKIIDVLISENIGPVEYLKEIKNYVLLDNLVKHQGMSPVESRAVTAITAVNNLFNKLKEPLSINEEIKNKIWFRD